MSGGASPWWCVPKPLWAGPNQNLPWCLSLSAFRSWHLGRDVPSFEMMGFSPHPLNSSLSLSQIKKNSAAAGFPWCFSSPILCVESYHFFLSLYFCFLKYLAHLALKYFVFLISALDLLLAHPKSLGGPGCTEPLWHEHGTLGVSPLYFLIQIPWGVLSWIFSLSQQICIHFCLRN